MVEGYGLVRPQSGHVEGGAHGVARNTTQGSTAPDSGSSPSALAFVIPNFAFSSQPGLTRLEPGTGHS